MIKHHKILLLIVVVLGLASFTNRIALAQERRTFVAFSMNAAREQVVEAVKQGTDWRKNSPDLFYLGGITKPYAIVLDTKSGDWILVGERDPKSSLLTLDDWVVALRARFIYSGRDPGVTIDPICPQGSLREDCRGFARQQVRFFGGIENTHFGQICYEADWLMKKIAFGLEKVAVKELKTYYDLSVEEHRRAGDRKPYVSVRFWFYPIINRVNVIDDVILLEKSQMGVFSEVLHAEVNGKPLDVENFKDYASEGFSRTFSENYDALAQEREVLETLRGLTRLAALAKGLTGSDQKPNIDFYLKDYSLPSMETTKEKEVLKVTNSEVGLQISGGVTLMALTMRLRGGDISALKEIIFESRKGPGSTPISWEFEMEMEAGQLKQIVLPVRSSDSNQIVQLFAQAVFLQKKKRYDSAIESYEKILQLDPRNFFAYYNRGIAYHEKGEYDRAISDFDKALILYPNFAESYYNRGLAYKNKDNYEHAINDYIKAIELNPNFAEAYLSRGVVYGEKRENDRAFSDFDKALTLNPNSAAAFYSRGVFYRIKDEYDRAINDFDKALALNPSFVEAYNSRGIAYHEKGEYDRAINDFDKALALNPNSSEAYNGRGIAYHEKGEYDRAIIYFNKALALNPNSPAAYYNLGRLFFKKGATDRAIANYTKALAIDPNGAEIYLNRALAWLTKGKYELAWVDVEKCRRAGGTPDLKKFIEMLNGASGRR